MTCFGLGIGSGLAEMFFSLWELNWPENNKNWIRNGWLEIKMTGAAANKKISVQLWFCDYVKEMIIQITSVVKSN